MMKINKMKLIVMIVIIVFFGLSFLCCLGSCFKDDNKATTKEVKKDISVELETEKLVSTPTKKPLSTVKPTEKPLKEYIFNNGNYKAGKDFKAGTYDITAIKGQGNVSSDNLLTGGINAIMGPQDDGFYQKEYKNINLPANTMLKITNVTIKLKEVE